MGSSRISGRSTGGSKTTPPTQIYRDDPVRDDGESVSAMSLHSNIGHHLIEDEPELPDEELPPYTDDEIGSAYTTRNNAVRRSPSPPLPPPPEFDLFSKDVQHIETVDSKGVRKYILSNKHTSDPAALEWAIREQLNDTPNAYLRIHGEHTEKRYDAQKKKTESHNVTDFDMKVDITDLHAPRSIRTISHNGLLSYRRDNWAIFVRSENNEKTYRGGITKSVNQMKTRYRVDIETQEGGEGEQETEDHIPTLTEFCHLFCASHYSLKSFELRNEVSDREDALLKSLVEQYVRATNYRGRIRVTFELNPRTITFQTKHKMNVARHTTWIWWMCIILQLWIITWPILYFTTKRWAVVKIQWPTRRYVEIQPGEPDYNPERHGQQRVQYRSSMFEKAFIERWRYTIQQGALNKCPMGTILTFAGQGAEEARALAERDAVTTDRRASEPQGGFVGGVLNLARGLSNLSREVNDSRGWGYDE